MLCRALPSLTVVNAGQSISAVASICCNWLEDATCRAVSAVQRMNAPRPTFFTLAGKVTVFNAEQAAKA